MSQTSRLALPLILPAQAQKHVTHNEALLRLDALTHLYLQSRTLSTPPEPAVDNHYFLVPEGATGPWADHAQMVAGFVNGAWVFYAGFDGLTAFIADEQVRVIWQDGAWQANSQGAGAADKLGINAVADDINRLSINAPASLFNHEGDGHQLKINKADMASTGSVLFQTGFSGRAEFGLTGSDDFAVRVSADGTNWKSALVIDAATAEVSLLETRRFAPPLFNNHSDGGRFAGTPEAASVIAGNFAAPSYLVPFNGATFSNGGSYIDNSTNFGGARGVMDAHILELLARMRPGASDAVKRFGPEFYALLVSAGSGVNSRLVVDGVSHYLTLTSPRVPVTHLRTLNFWVRAETGSTHLMDDGSAEHFVNGQKITGNYKLEPADSWQVITRRITSAMDSFANNDPNPLRLYATPNSQYRLAALTLYPGHFDVRADTPIGIISSR